MTAPTNQPLPVVACVIWNLTSRPDMPLVIAESAHRALGAHSTDIPADAAAAAYAAADAAYAAEAADAAAWATLDPVGLLRRLIAVTDARVSP